MKAEEKTMRVENFKKGVVTLIDSGKRLAQRDHDNGEDWMKHWSLTKGYLTGLEITLSFAGENELLDWVEGLDKEHDGWIPKDNNTTKRE